MPATYFSLEVAVESLHNLIVSYAADYQVKI